MDRNSFLRHHVRQSFQNNLEAQKEYADTIERLIESETERFARWAGERIKKLPPDVLDDIYSDEYWQLKEGFPNRLRSSMIVTGYTLLEKSLSRICKIYSNEKGLTIKLSDLKKQGIEGAKEYFKKALQIDFPSDSREWAEIQYYRKLRNAIAHHDGEISEDNEEIRSYIAKKSTLNTTRFGNLMVEKEFVTEVFETIENFMNQVFLKLHR